MQIDALVFLRQVEHFIAAVGMLDDETGVLSRDIAALRRQIPADYADAHTVLAAMDGAVDRMAAARDMLLRVMEKLLPPSGGLGDS